MAHHHHHQHNLHLFNGFIRFVCTFEMSLVELTGLALAVEYISIYLYAKWNINISSLEFMMEIELGISRARQHE